MRKIKDWFRYIKDSIVMDMYFFLLSHCFPLWFCIWGKDLKEEGNENERN